MSVPRLVLLVPAVLAEAAKLVVLVHKAPLVKSASLVFPVLRVMLVHVV